MNKAIIIGHLGADPDVRYTQNNILVANISVATTEKYRNRNGDRVEKTEWHRVNAWDKRGEVLQNYAKKGDRVCIEGKIETRKWEDKDGVTRYTTEIRAENIELLGSPGGSRNGEVARPPAQKPAEKTGTTGDLPNIDSDNDLPF